MKSKEDLQASLNILKEAIKQYDNGVTDFYRVVATELRKLLCDSNPLLVRVFPQVRLHKFNFTQVLENHPNLADSLQILIPGEIRIHFIPKFVGTNNLMELNDWLKQPILIYGEIDIYNLIKSVADKEGAHSDPSFNETILLSKLIKINNADSYKPVIVGIGEYIFNLITNEYLID